MADPEMVSRAPVVAIDLDETIIDSRTSELVPGARDAILRLKKLGWKIVIWTARAHAKRDVPKILRRWGIPYDAINENLPDIDDDSRKIHFDAVIDNKNVDFQAGWEAALEELQRRREGWRDLGLSKVFLKRLDPDTGEEVVAQIWEDVDGTAVCTFDDGSVDLKSLGLHPEQNPDIEKDRRKKYQYPRQDSKSRDEIPLEIPAIASQTYLPYLYCHARGTYLWAETSRGYKGVFDYVVGRFVK